MLPAFLYTKRYILKINDAPEDENKIMVINIKLLLITSRHRQTVRLGEWRSSGLINYIARQRYVVVTIKPNLENIQAKQTNGEALKSYTLTVVIKWREK